MQLSLQGTTRYHSGRVAEDSVARVYDSGGQAVAHRRWRAASGEIDLIARNGDQVVFIEVKKSRSFGEAAARLGRRQMDRICAAATEFLAGEPLGQLTDVRFDLALVDGHGAVQVIENAFGAA